MKKTGSILFLLYLFLVSINVFSVEISLYSEQSEVFRGESFRFVVNIKDYEKTSAKPVFRELKNVKILSQGTSYNTTIVNFKSSVNYQFIYQAVSTSTGEIIIGPASVEIDGKEYKTDRLIMKSVDRAKSSSDNNDFIVIQETDKKEYFIGEEIKYSIVFATSLKRVRNFRMTESDVFKEFVAGKGEDRQGEKIINGKRYTVLQIDKTYFPLKPGEYNIDDLLISVDVASTSKKRSMFDDSFFEDSFSDDFFSAFSSNWETRSMTAKNISFKVKSLPQAPDDFSEGVGKFIISAKVEEGKKKQGEPFQIKYIVSGKGNLSKIKRPVIDSNENFSVSYSGEEINESENRNSGEKIFNYIIIPEKSGKLVIPEAKLTYFDIENGSYVTSNTQSLKIDIEKNSEYKGVVSNTADYTNNDGDDVKYRNSITGKDIEYIKTYNSKSEFFYLFRKITLFLNYILIVLLFLYFIFFKIILKTGNKKRIVSNTLKTLKRSLDNGDFLYVFNNIYWKALCSILNIENEISVSLIIERLNIIFPDDIYNKKLSQLNDNINFAAYSGKQKSDLIILYNEAEELLYHYADRKVTK